MAESSLRLPGLDLEATTEALLPKTVFVHVKDGETADGKTRFLLPGEGTTDYAALFRQLHQARFRGDVLVEVSSQVFNRAGYEPIASARNCESTGAAAMPAAQWA